MSNDPAGKESACSAGNRFSLWLRKRQWQPTPVFLPEKSHGQRSLVGYSSKGCRELDMTEQLSTYRRRYSRNPPYMLQRKCQ